jgi:hypothetical protein
MIPVAILLVTAAMLLCAAIAWAVLVLDGDYP